MKGKRFDSVELSVFFRIGKKCLHLAQYRNHTLSAQRKSKRLTKPELQ